jgi:hypothetical protein
VEGAKKAGRLKSSNYPLTKLPIYQILSLTRNAAITTTTKFS